MNIEKIVIKFGHASYAKFDFGALVPKEAYLIGVMRCKKSELPNVFVEYDTLYGWDFDEKHFKISSEDLLLLVLFDSTNDNLFTTLRSYNAEKEEYYKQHLNELVKIEITEFEGV